MSDSAPRELTLNRRTTALVLIDFQKRIVAMNTAPRPTGEVVATGATLADRCRALGIPVVLTCVDFHADGRDRLTTPVDLPMGAPATPMPDGAHLVPEINASAQDLLITKHQWSAFYGTDLDLQLRRRGIDTILLGGLVTNFGVESTGRFAWEQNYQVVFVEDAMASLAAEAHQFAVSVIFPRIGRVRTSAEVLKALV